MADKYFFKADEGVFEPVNDLVKRKIIACGGDMMIVEVHFQKGGIGAMHEHFHEQVTYCIKGKLEFTVGDQTTIIEAGDSVYMPPDLIHGAKVLEEAILLDIFAPQREDFLAQREEFLKNNPQ